MNSLMMDFWIEKPMKKEEFKAYTEEVRDMLMDYFEDFVEWGNNYYFNDSAFYFIIHQEEEYHVHLLWQNVKDIRVICQLEEEEIYNFSDFERIQNFNDIIKKIITGRERG